MAENCIGTPSPTLNKNEHPLFRYVAPHEFGQTTRTMGLSCGVETWISRRRLGIRINPFDFSGETRIAVTGDRGTGCVLRRDWKAYSHFGDILYSRCTTGPFVGKLPEVSLPRAQHYILSQRNEAKREERRV